MNPYVSIPFIAGQWSLPDAYRPGVLLRAAFQSPSLRGSGRFASDSPIVEVGAGLFQSPSLRGSGRFCRNPGFCLLVRGVSIPFIAGQWSLRVATHRRPDLEAGFNPLHCGAVVASRSPYGGRGRRRQVSIPFIAGQWSLRRADAKAEFSEPMFQSPSLRGSGRFSRLRWRRAPAGRFNPLHCGAVVASRGAGEAPPAHP